MLQYCNTSQSILLLFFSLLSGCGKGVVTSGARVALHVIIKFSGHFVFLKHKLS